jgi:DNA-directed RNA polymerase beta' subunit
MELTVGENVTQLNIERMQQLFDNGKNYYPGSNYLVKKDTKKYSTENVNVKLEIGDTLYRHL